MIRRIVLALLAAFAVSAPALAAAPCSTLADYSRAALPYDTTFNASFAGQGGGGDQFYWRPEMTGFDPVTTSASGVVIRAIPLSLADRAAIAGMGSRMRATTADANTASQAKVKSGWLQCRTELLDDYAVEQLINLSPSPYAWGPGWGWSSGAAWRKLHLEVDYAEYAGGVLRQVVHYADPTDPTGKRLLTFGCPVRHAPGWLRAGFRKAGLTITFTLDGRDTCSVTIPAAYDAPITLIMSLQAGGLAKPIDAAAGQFSVAMGWPKVTVLP